MKLNQEQLDRFIEMFQIKAKSVVLIKKKEKVTVVINSVIVFDVNKELVKDFI